jgi:hypothetical protein
MGGEAPVTIELHDADLLTGLVVLALVVFVAVLAVGYARRGALLVHIWQEQ